MAHSYRDEYWLRLNKHTSSMHGNTSARFSPDGSSFSLHAQFQAYVQDNADRLEISGRPPMPNRIDMALSMERQWEEVRSNLPGMLQPPRIDDAD
jgi:hypothetical protein